MVDVYILCWYTFFVIRISNENIPLYNVDLEYFGLTLVEKTPETHSLFGLVSLTCFLCVCN